MGIESQLPILESLFFFGWNPMESDAFFPWNPMESDAFFWNPRAYIRPCFLWVLNFEQVGEILENFQNHPLGESF